MQRPLVLLTDSVVIHPISSGTIIVYPFHPLSNASDIYENIITISIDGDNWKFIMKRISPK